ncbi:MAG: hypothetical protein ACKPB9_33150, partial [Dolichospermum sp.]
RANQPQLFITHALLKAQGKEFIKNIQIRLILQPIIEQLIPESEFINTQRSLKKISNNLSQSYLEKIDQICKDINDLRNQINLEYMLVPILDNLRESVKRKSHKKLGYAAGNILNLLIQERIEKQQPVLSDHDFSLVDIWQADLSRIFI